MAEKNTGKQKVDVVRKAVTIRDQDDVVRAAHCRLCFVCVFDLLDGFTKVLAIIFSVYQSGNAGSKRLDSSTGRGRCTAPLRLTTRPSLVSSTV